MIRYKKFRSMMISLSLGLCGTMAFAETTKKANAGRKASANTASPSASSPVKVNSNDSEDGYVAASSTHIDFSETAIDGKMKAPEGFLLQSRQSSSLSQMVKLRSNFRNELNNSKSATKAIVK